MRTDVAVAGHAPADDLSRRRRMDGIVLLVGAMATLLAVGLLLDSVTHSSLPPRPRRQLLRPAFVAAGATDSFARGDIPRSLGEASSGQIWFPVRGVWAVREHMAAVVRPASGTSLVTMPVGVRNGRVSVTAARIAPGLGLAFRCRGALNCWRVEAVPALGTWNVVKVVAGKESLLGNLGTVPVASGTTITVDMMGDRLAFFIDGARVRTVHDRSLDRETGAGLSLREPASAPTARWSAFRMVPRAEAGLLSTADATVHDEFDRSDAPTLGVTPTGERWRAVSATWVIRDRQAAVRSRAGRSQIATLDLTSANGTLQASLLVVPQGAGIVFRYRDERNYWKLEASPGFATWDVTKVVAGKATRLGNLGLVSAEAGTTVSVRMRGKALTFFVNGRRARSLTDGSLMHDHIAGMIAPAGKSATHARWSQFLYAADEKRS